MGYSVDDLKGCRIFVVSEYHDSQPQRLFLSEEEDSVHLRF